MTKSRHPVCQLTSLQRYYKTLSYSPHIDRAALRGDTAIGAMADDMRMFFANQGLVTETDLAVVGWSKTQRDLYGAAARELACRRSAA